MAHIRSENTSGTDFSEQPYPRKRMRSTRTRVQVLCSTFYHKKGPSRLRLGMICEYLFCRVSIRPAHAGNWIAVLELNSRTVHLAVRVQLCTVRVSKVVRRSYNFIISTVSYEGKSYLLYVYSTRINIFTDKTNQILYNVRR